MADNKNLTFVLENMSLQDRQAFMKQLADQALKGDDNGEYQAALQKLDELSSRLQK